MRSPHCIYKGSWQMYWQECKKIGFMTWKRTHYVFSYERKGLIIFVCLNKYFQSRKSNSVASVAARIVAIKLYCAGKCVSVTLHKHATNEKSITYLSFHHLRNKKRRLLFRENAFSPFCGDSLLVWRHIITQFGNEFSYFK